MASKKDASEQPQETAVPYMDAAPFPAPGKPAPEAQAADETEVAE